MIVEDMPNAPKNRYEEEGRLLKEEALKLSNDLRTKTTELFSIGKKLEDKIKELAKIDGEIKRISAQKSEIHKRRDEILH